jgi:hypothetical protein
MFKKKTHIILLSAMTILVTACSSLAAPQVSSQDTTSQNPSAARVAVDQPVTLVTDNTNVAASNTTSQTTSSFSYTIVDTGQDYCYNNTTGIACPTESESFYGQDAQYQGTQAQYVDNRDGTVTDLNTSLMWQQTPNLDDKVTFKAAVTGAETFELAGYTDWRLPTIKELYSLIDFNGSASQDIPYVDTDYFDFQYGDESQGERQIDAQYWSSTEYVGTTMNGNHTVFGVNFADGRIKGYGTSNPNGGEMVQFVRYVRSNPDYGINDFIANNDGTITDQATGLMWQASDSELTLDWEGALDYCESLDTAGYTDWRLPNAKELQSIVNYTRSPQTTNSAAINPIFDLTETESWFWSSTTHLDTDASNAVYIAFGQAFGLPNGNLVDVHGAGAQRSDPKSGNPANYSEGRGTPGQDDQVRIYNYARCIRGGVSDEVFVGGEVDTSSSNFGPPTGNPPEQNGQLPTSQSSLPKEVIAACADLAEGSACTVDTPHGMLTGNCTTIPSGELACVPQNEQRPTDGRGARP